MTDSRKTGSSSAADDLERLRELILGEDMGQLHQIFRRVKDPELRTGDVAEVLPGAMNRTIEDPVTRPAIQRPIVETIRGAIRSDAESFAEALFPVLGPAIRRAVADSLKSLVQRINVALEHSFTIKGLRWRLEAARSGVPFAQIVLRETMLYAVQEVFLIQPDSGLVLAKVRRDETLVLDEDAFSAMLTAIQAFIQDSLGMPMGEKLRSAELGESSLWVISGPDAVLACVFSGSPPLDLRNQMMDTLETLHAQYGDQFRQPPEQLEGHPGIAALLQETLKEEVAEASEASAKTKQWVFWGGVGMLLMLLLVWGAWGAYQFNRLEQQVASRFEAEPGYLLTTHETRDGKLLLVGLRDPLAASPESLLQSISVDAEDVSLAFRPYQSLEEEIIIRRLRSALGDDPNLVLQISGTSLQVRGTLTEAQFAMLEELSGTHPVIRSVDLSQVRRAGQDAADAGATAEAKANAALDLQHQQLNALLSRIDGQTIIFTQQLEISPVARKQLDVLADNLLELHGLAAALQQDLNLTLEGFADGSGSPARNRELSMGRARKVQSELSNRGIDPAQFTLDMGHWDRGGVDPKQRKAVIHAVREPAR